MRNLLIFTLMFCFQVQAKDLVTLHKESGVSVPYFFDKSENKGHEFKAYDITEIGMQKTSCFGRCPIFWVNVKVDGSVEYQGHLFVEKIGRHTGKVEQYQLANILAYINEVNFLGLQDVYTYDVTDNPSIYTMVKTSYKQKIIKNYANAGPMKLWALEQLLDQLLKEVKWDKGS